MRIDRGVAARVLVKWNLLICVSDIQLTRSKALPTSQLSEQVVDFRQGIGIEFGGLVDFKLIVSTNSDVAVSLHYGHDWSSPF